MKVLACTAMVFLTVALGSGASASGRTRIARAEYSRLEAVEADGWTMQCGKTTAILAGALGYPAPYESILFEVRDRETAASIQVHDRIPGQRVAGFVYYVLPNGDERVTSFCGATQRPIQLAPDQMIEVRLLSDGVSDAGPWLLTQGRVQATFYRR
jgi:hypothetical protein